jgi:hypothetical protein
MDRQKEFLLESLRVSRAVHDRRLEEAAAIGDVSKKVLAAFSEARNDPNGGERLQKLREEFSALDRKASELTKLYLKASYDYDKDEDRLREYLAANPDDPPKYGVEPVGTFGEGE